MPLEGGAIRMNKAFKVKPPLGFAAHLLCDGEKATWPLYPQVSSSLKWGEAGLSGLLL